MARKDRSRRRRRIKARRKLRELQVAKRACKECGKSTNLLVCAPCVTKNLKSA